MEEVDDLVLGTMLLERGMVTQKQLDEARARAHITGKPLATILVDANFVPRQKLFEVLEEHTVKTVADASPVLAAAAAKPGAAIGPDEQLPPDVAAMAARPDYTFDKYVLVGLLGRGGAGEVWKCWDRQAKRYVAIKFLESHQESDVDRFMREAETASQVDHPHITKLYEFNVHEDRIYIVMQFVDGVTLQQHLGALPFPKVARIVRDIAGALEHAHRRGIIHRDIKPSNIMIDKRGRAYLMDFGLAKAVTDEMALTMVGQILGTPAYMSPEQAESRFKDMDGRCDVYSLGATLWALVTGRAPVEGGSPMEKAARVIKGDIPKPREINPAVPEQLEAVILKAMQVNRDKRYPTAGEMAQDLTKYIADSASTGTTISAVRTFTTTAKTGLREIVTQHRLALGIAAGMLVLLLAIVITAVVTGGGEEEKPAPPPPVAPDPKPDDALKLKMATLDFENALLSEASTGADIDKAADAVIAAGADAALKRRALVAKLDFEGALKDATGDAAAIAGAMWGYWLDVQRDWTGRRGCAEGDAARRRGLGRGEGSLVRAAAALADRDWKSAVDAAYGAGEGWEARFLLALALTRAGRHAEAVAPAEAAARAQRANAVVQHLAAAVHLNRHAGDTVCRTPSCREQADRHLDPLSRLRPEAAPCVWIRAMHDVLSARFEDAERVAGRLAKGGASLRAFARVRAGRVDEALDLVKQAEADRAWTHVVRGMAHEARKETAAAIEAYGKAIELEKDNIDALIARAWLLYRENRAAEGAADAERAARGDLTYAHIHVAMLVDAGRHEDAGKAGGAYERLAPQDYRVAWKTGWARACAKDFLGAVESLDRAEKLAPAGAAAHRASILSWRGEAHLRLNNAERALGDLDRSVQLHAEGLAMCRRGEALGVLGRFKDAAESLRKGIEMDASCAGRYEPMLRDFEKR